MDSKQEKALEYFNNGCNCCQSVALVLAPEDVSTDQMSKLSTGFGGGIGGTQDVCGTVSGAVMGLGFKYGKGENDGPEKIKETYGKVRQFINNFKEERSSIYCRELLGCDITTEEGQAYRKEHNLRETVCCECVKTAVKLAESI